MCYFESITYKCDHDIHHHLRNCASADKDPLGFCFSGKVIHRASTQNQQDCHHCERTAAEARATAAAKAAEEAQEALQAALNMVLETKRTAEAAAKEAEAWKSKGVLTPRRK